MKRNTRLHNAALTGLAAMGLALATGGFRHFASAQDASRAVSMANRASTERWTVNCAGGLTGGTIHITGLSGTVVDVLVRLECLDGIAEVIRLTPSAPSFPVEPRPADGA